MYNDIASHWCGHSYDRLCWDGYTAKEVKTKVSFHHGFSSRRTLKLGGKEERKTFMVLRLVYIRPRRLYVAFFVLYPLFILVHCQIANSVQVFCDFNVGFKLLIQKLSVLAGLNR